MSPRFEKISSSFIHCHVNRLVINTISSMDGDRKAFRLIGGVLIQQTVGDVLPAVTTHQAMVSLKSCPMNIFNLRSMSQIKQLLETVGGTLKSKEREAKMWKVKYNIQTQQERELARQPAPSSNGVLA